MQKLLKTSATAEATCNSTIATLMCQGDQTANGATIKLFSKSSGSHELAVRKQHSQSLGHP